MISEISCICNLLFVGASYVVRNRDTYMTAYSYCDMAKFVYMVYGDIGTNRGVGKKNTCTVLIIDGSESTEFGEFELIDIV